MSEQSQHIRKTLPGPIALPADSSVPALGRITFLTRRRRLALVRLRAGAWKMAQLSSKQAIKSFGSTLGKAGAICLVSHLTGTNLQDLLPW
ncbi:hypothetical protein [Streptomyces anulatus]|uniref:hypothetical protein n=1 Tax=Streptomyces anulatus TaxID=1892 RepID=UPI0012FEC65B|nr:hypothetical protein [Streptomyces anulatus]